MSQLLTLMDGLKSRAHVIVMGATNRPNRCTDRHASIILTHLHSAVLLCTIAQPFAGSDLY